MRLFLLTFQHIAALLLWKVTQINWYKADTFTSYTALSFIYLFFQMGWMIEIVLFVELRCVLRDKYFDRCDINSLDAQTEGCTCLSELFPVGV